MVERIAGLVETDILRQHHRQVLVRHRHDVAGRAMDHRDRTTPIALARNAPVAQPEIHLALADWPHACLRGRERAHLRFQAPGNLFLGLLDGHAVEEARIDHAAVAVIGGVGDDEGARVLALGTDHRRVAEPVFVDEIEVALVMRGTAEDRAGAVFHQHEIGDVDRQLPVRIERMDRPDAGIEAELLGGVDDFLRGAVALGLGDELGKLRIFRGRRLRQRMIRRDRHELGAEQRVMPRGEYLQLALAGRRGRRIERKADQHALGAPDPVALHQPHLVGPAVERIERVQQLLRIFGDLEHPLLHLALFDRRAGTPAAAVDHLLVRQHGHVDRVPVDLALLALGQSRAQEIQEHLLLVLVIRGIAGREFPAPVERQPDRLQLLLHRRDVVVGPRLGRDLALDRGVFRRQPERVPAHRVQHVIALGTHEARQHVAQRIVADMPDMDAPGRVGEHLEHVIFRPRIVVFGGENGLVRPTGAASAARIHGRCSVRRSWGIRRAFAGFGRFQAGGLGHKSGFAVNGLGGCKAAFGTSRVDRLASALSRRRHLVRTKPCSTTALRPRCLAA